MLLPAHWLKSLVSLGIAATAATGADPGESRVVDRELAKRIRTVLSADSQLRSSSLLISVVDRVAVVGGEVRTSEEQLRLQRLLSLVPGLTETRLSTWTPIEKLAPSVPIVPPRLIAREDGDSRTRGRITAQSNPPTEEPAPRLLAPTPAPESRPLASRHGSAYSPVPAPIPPAPAGPPEYPTIPPVTVPVTPDQNVTSAVEELRLGETRFSSLTLRVKAGLIVIECDSWSSEVAWEFAEQARKVPGVDRVVVSSSKSR